MGNKTEALKVVKKWQRVLGFKGWKITVQFTDFKRQDFKQSGDVVNVDLKAKEAKILISKNPIYSYEQVIIHELIHLLFWEYDHFCEGFVPRNKTDRYFDLLEEVVARLTTVMIQTRK